MFNSFIFYSFRWFLISHLISLTLSLCRYNMWRPFVLLVTARLLLMPRRSPWKRWEATEERSRQVHLLFLGTHCSGECVCVCVTAYGKLYSASSDGFIVGDWSVAAMGCCRFNWKELKKKVATCALVCVRLRAKREFGMCFLQGQKHQRMSSCTRTTQGLKDPESWCVCVCVWARTLVSLFLCGCTMSVAPQKSRHLPAHTSTAVEAFHLSLSPGCDNRMNWVDLQEWSVVSWIYWAADFRVWFLIQPETLKTLCQPVHWQIKMTFDSFFQMKEVVWCHAIHWNVTDQHLVIVKWCKGYQCTS